METIIIDIMNKFGYFGIFFLIALENVFPPIPSEVILLFGGFMTTKAKLNIVGVIIASTLGAVVGALILYYIGKILNKERLKKLLQGKFGKITRLKSEDVDKADEWFDTKGNKTVFFCRFIPIIRSLISIPAGMSEMPMPKFLLYTVAGTAIWNTVLTIAGSIVGENWQSIVKIIDNYAHITLIVLIILFIIFVVYYMKKRSNKKED